MDRLVKMLQAMLENGIVIVDMTKKETKIVVFNAGGNKAKILPSDFNKKIFAFMKSLTGDDYGAFFIYQEGFLTKDTYIPERLN